MVQFSFGFVFYSTFFFTVPFIQNQNAEFSESIESVEKTLKDFFGDHLFIGDEN